MKVATPQISTRGQRTPLPSASLQKKRITHSGLSFNDLREEALAQTTMQQTVDSSPRMATQRIQLSHMMGNEFRDTKESAQRKGNSSNPTQLQAMTSAQRDNIHVSPRKKQHFSPRAWHIVQSAQGNLQSTKQTKEGPPGKGDQWLGSEPDVIDTAQRKTLDPALEAESKSVAVTRQRRKTAREADAKEPVFELYKGKSVNTLGHVSTLGGQYKFAKTTGVNVRAKPDGTLQPIAKVLYDTEVQVRAFDNTEAFYFVIAKTGVVGWINKNFVVLNPPDPGSRLHHVTESDLTTILKREYVDTKLWELGTGNDYTTLAAAVVAANNEQAGVWVDWDKARQYKEENAFKRWLDPWMIDNFAIYHGSQVKKGANIWLPSPTYVRMLQKSDVIGARPTLVNAAADVGKGIAGFHAGIVAGVFGSLWDTLTGLWELGKSIVGTVKSVLDGSILASIEAMYDTIAGMTWEKFKAMVDEVITMGKSAFNDFEKKWNHPNTYNQWHFKGYIIGAIALEVVLAIFTGGGTLALKVLAKIGKYLPKLMGIFNRLLALAKKLPGRRGKGRTQNSGKRKEHDRDRDSDDKEMSQDDRAWEQARALAKVVTEGHDKKNTPVTTLIPMLNATIGSKFKGVRGYEAIPLGPPHTYKIIQLARKKDVDNHYTEEEGEIPKRTQAEEKLESLEKKQGRKGDPFSVSPSSSKPGADPTWVNRFHMYTLEDLVSLKQKRPRKPQGLTEDQEVLWADFIRYYNKRLANMENQLHGTGLRSNPPRTWESYRTVRESRSGQTVRGRAHQDRVTHSMKDLKHDFLTESDVGVSRVKTPGRKDVKFADQLILDRSSGELIAVSNKSRNFRAKVSDYSTTELNKVREQVKKDVQELYEKYGGELYVRRKTHPLYNQKDKKVSELILVYENSSGLVNHDLMRIIRSTAGQEAHRLNPNIDFHFAAQ